MPEPAILHVCPHCERVFDSPSICMPSGTPTEPRPVAVSSQQFRELQRRALRPVYVRDLKRGDIVMFGDARHRVQGCGPSSIDPVYLIAFEGRDGLIAKSPDDIVAVAREAAPPQNSKGFSA